MFDFALPDETHRATRPEVMAVAELLGKGWQRRLGRLRRMLTMAKAIARARVLGVPLGVRDVAYRYGIDSATFVRWLHDQRHVWHEIADLVEIDPDLGVSVDADKRVDWDQPDNRVSDRQWGEIQELVASMAPTIALDADARAVLDVVAAVGNAGYWLGRAPSRERVERIADSAGVGMDLLDSLGTTWRAVSEDEVTLWEHLLAIMDIPGDLPIGAPAGASFAWPTADEMDPDELDPDEMEVEVDRAATSPGGSACGSGRCLSRLTNPTPPRSGCRSGRSPPRGGRGGCGRSRGGCGGWRTRSVSRTGCCARCPTSTRATGTSATARCVRCMWVGRRRRRRRRCLRLVVLTGSGSW